ncbi:MAG TPA: hypothetical protein VH111_12315 [Steroidobacteraceae bacterium]|nr:hypothetical protein [Steroidobacteraceae bacterium]
MTYAAAGIVAAAAVAAAGCTALAVHLGLRMRLDRVPVSAVSAVLVAGRGHSTMTALAPGQSAQLVIVATTSQGRKFATVGAGGGKVLFDSYLLDASVVQVGRKGEVSLPADPRWSEGKAGHLRITPVGHPDVVTELDIPVRYDVAYRADFSGANGAAGADGTDGEDGAPGSDANMVTDPSTGAQSYQGAGSPGANGGSGGNGSDGDDGEPGGNVRVSMRLVDGGRPLLQVRAVSGGRESLFLVDPHGGSLTVLANGGRGGAGGSGGRGGSGGSGGNGSPPGPSGSNGSRGFDGRAGRAGRAGTITVLVDPGAESYLSCLSYSNHSGNGAPGFAPLIHVEPVGKLW